MNFQLDNLSPHDFTELVRDLLSAHLKLDLRVSVEGRDRGVDIGYWGDEKTPDVVIQCKYTKAPSGSRLPSLLKSERPKVAALDPGRYIVASFHKVSVEGKQRIFDLFQPWMKSVNDVFGRDDLKGLMRDHPEIVRNHVKLWITSPLLLEGARRWEGELARKYHKKKLQDSAKLYVETASFAEAISILNEDRVVVISGAPGIGKTTLAHNLILWLLQSYDRAIELDPQRADLPELADHEKVIIYYDDFLGTSSWKDNSRENLTRSVDRLIRLVQYRPNTCLILTTRSYLLHEACSQSDPFRDILPRLRVKEVRIKEFSQEARAYLIYNHLYHSTVDGVACKSLCSASLIQRILSHENFVPRMIEWAVDSASWPKGLSPSDFAGHLIATLDDSSRLYRTTIESYLSDEARNLILVMFLFEPSGCTPDTLKDRYLQFTQAHQAHYPRKAFEAALKEVVGSLASFGCDRWDREVVRYSNPGVADCCRAIILEREEIWRQLLLVACDADEFVVLGRCLASRDISSRPKGLTQEWVGKWASLAASLPEIDLDDLLTSISGTFWMKLWEGQESVLERLLDQIRAVEEGEGLELEWWRLVTSNAEQILGRIEWLPSWIEKSVRCHNWCDDDMLDTVMELPEAGSFGKALTDGSYGFAVVRAESLLSATKYDEDGEECLDRGLYSKLSEIADRYDLAEVKDKMRSIYPSDPAPSTTTVPQPRIQPGDSFSTADALRLFEKLAALKEDDVTTEPSGTSVESSDSP